MSQDNGKSDPFLRIPAAAWETVLRDAEPSVLRVYCELAWRAGPKRVCWPSVATIANDLGISPRSVYRAIGFLEANGLIIRDSGNHTGKTTRYHLPASDMGVSRSPDTPLAGDMGVSSLLTCVSLPTDMGVTQNKVKEQGKENKVNHLPGMEVAEVEKKPAKHDSEEAMQAVVTAWNEMAKSAGIPTARSLTDSRKDKLRVRLANADWRSSWREALDAIPSRPFLLGNGPRGWKADFDFFLRPDSVNAILEDKYSAAGTSSSTQTKYRGAVHPDDLKEDGF
jgi:Fe2+ or Zn2+ uptake regulation protein